MNEGFIVINRKMMEWQFYQCPNACAIWMHILLSANWRDGWFQGVKVQRGMFVTSIEHFADECGLSPSTIRRWLKKFEIAGQIEVKATNRFTQISVVNYGKYQDIPIEGEQTDEQTDEQTKGERMNNNRTRITRITKNNNDKDGARFVPPTMDDAKNLWAERHYFSDYTRFWNYYQSNGWHAGRVKMQDWKASAAGWESRERQSASRSGRQRVPDFEDPYSKSETHETAEQILERRLRDGV